MGDLMHPTWLNRPIANAASTFEIWRDEFLGTYALGGLFNLTMHPQISGMPSRLLWARKLIRFIKKHRTSGGPRAARSPSTGSRGRAGADPLASDPAVLSSRPTQFVADRCRLRRKCQLDGVGRSVAADSPMRRNRHAPRTDRTALARVARRRLRDESGGRRRALDGDVVQRRRQRHSPRRAPHARSDAVG